MKYKIDLHVHSNVSTHAYSTLEELISRAKINNLEAFALTNHGPTMPDSPHEYHFSNMKVFPEIIDGIKLYKGIEANIIDENGEIDLPMKYYNYLDIVLAGFHDQTPYGEGNNIEKNTKAIINVLKSGYVDILAHIGNPKFLIDYEKVIKIAAEYNVAVELNNSSFLKSRKGSEKNCIKVLELCKKYKAFISLGSDTHFSPNIGNLKKVEELLEKIKINENQIINTSVEKTENFLKLHRKNIK